LTHFIYSSHSNGATSEELAKKKPKAIDSGGLYGADYHKYRVIIPCTYNREQLPALLDHLFKELHHDGVMLAAVTENRTWAQAWYLPRIPDLPRYNFFYFESHIGSTLNAESIFTDWLKTNPASIANPAYVTKTLDSVSKHAIRAISAEHGSSITTFNETHDLIETLESFGYIKKDKDRWLSPYSQSGLAGVLLCRNCKDGKLRFYSTHGSDSWNDGKPKDAYDLYRILGCGGDMKTALNWNPELTKQIQRDHMKKQANNAQQPSARHDNVVPLGNAKASVQQDSVGKTISTHNHILDSDQKYCSVDLLQYLDDSHLLKSMSVQTAAIAHLPESTVALMGLSVFSSVASRNWTVLYQDGDALPIGLYAVAEQPSGTGKSRCINVFQKPFRIAERKVVKTIQDKLKTLEEKTDHDDFEKQELKSLKAQKTHLFTSNSTPEGLEMTLEHTKGFFSAVSSEQGLFNSLLGLSYNSGSANNNDVTLQGFDGGYASNGRVTRQGYVGEVIGSVVCFAQQGSIEKILDASNGTGLSERFLMIAEQHKLGTRDHTKRVYKDDSLDFLYSKACDFAVEILENPKEFDDLNQLKISDNGHNLINKFQNTIEPHIADGGKYSHGSLRSAASKINMQIMKIAANIHLMDRESYQPNIPDRHVISAIGIAGTLLEGNLKLCMDKGIIGVKAEFTSILSLFEREKMRTERIIITTKVKASPFKDFTGNKSDLIRKTLDEMVSQRLLTKLVFDGKPAYQLGQ